MMIASQNHLMEVKNIETTLFKPIAQLPTLMRNSVFDSFANVTIAIVKSPMVPTGGIVSQQ